MDGPYAQELPWEDQIQISKKQANTQPWYILRQRWSGELALCY